MLLCCAVPHLSSRCELPVEGGGQATYVTAVATYRIIGHLLNVPSEAQVNVCIRSSVLRQWRLTPISPSIYRSRYIVLAVTIVWYVLNAKPQNISAALQGTMDPSNDSIKETMK